VGNPDGADVGVPAQYAPDRCGKCIATTNCVGIARGIGRQRGKVVYQCPACVSPSL
jgi:hypothetical protein